jgi:hypothetical protein
MRENSGEMMLFPGGANYFESDRRLCHSIYYDGKPRVIITHKVQLIRYPEFVIPHMKILIENGFSIN